MVNRLKKCFRKWRESRGLISLFRSRRRPAQSSTAGLYILRVDFPVKAELLARIQATLDPIKKKYGIDFLVLEPGINLSRFDDI